MSYLITPRESVNFTDKLTLAQQRIDAGITGNRLAPQQPGVMASSLPLPFQ